MKTIAPNCDISSPLRKIFVTLWCMPRLLSIRFEDYPKKEKLFVSLGPDDVAKVIDASIALVRRMETEVHGRPQKWLRDRDEDGLFPDDVFE